MKPITGVWAEPVSAEEYAMLEGIRRDKRYAGERVLLFEGKVVEHCPNPQEFGKLTLKYRGQRTFAAYVPEDRPFTPLIL